MPGLPIAKEGKPPTKPAHGFPFFYSRKRIPRVITGDIWSFLKNSSSRKLKQLSEKKAIAYIEQAHDFFSAASNQKQSSRPLLYYYAFLNIAKVVVLHAGADLPPKLFHGIADPKANAKVRLRFEKQVVTVDGRARDHSLILPELIHAVAPERSSSVKGDYNVLELLSEIPAVHRTYHQTTNVPETFIPAKRLVVKTNGREAWAELVLARERLPTRFREYLDDDDFKGVFKQVRSQDHGFLVFQSAAERYRGSQLDTVIGKLAKRVRSCGVYTICTEVDGFRSYLSIGQNPKTLPQMCSAYAVMFYLGSLTRYKPYDYDKVTAKYEWLINEFLDTQPTQVLHLAASYIAKTEVVAPKAARQRSS